MISFNTYVQDIAESYGIVDPGFLLNISSFLIANNWFGIKAVLRDNEVYVSEADLERIGKRIDSYCAFYNSDNKSKLDYLIERLEGILPETANLLRKYIRTMSLQEEAAYYLTDFILYYLPGEIRECRDLEIATLVDDAFDNLPKIYGDILTGFVNWVSEKKKTIYQQKYFLNSYSDGRDNGAYDEDHYLRILYHLTNAEYIDRNDMLVRAAESKNFVDAWLYLLVHFISALRFTDIIRLPHPKLPASPEEVLDQIAGGTFTETDARYVINTILWTLNAYKPTPNKTRGTYGVGAVKFLVPESLEVLLGTLFAAAESHFRISGKDPSDPLIRKISTYEQISRYLGEEIGDLFLAADFSGRAANKSYLQMAYLLSDEILDDESDDLRLKGYTIAAAMRSHKGSYGSFAKTTATYLKDAKMSGFTPEFVAKELFERGVLSLIPSMLLKMVLGRDYEKLSVRNQTKLIRELNLSPLEVETAVQVMQQNMKRSAEIVKELFQTSDEHEVLEVLHRIGNGMAPSKYPGSQCLMTAMQQGCPFDGHGNCPACDYEIGSKTTIMLLAGELQRLSRQYQHADKEIEKQRSKVLARDIVVPRLEELLRIVEEQYGAAALAALEKVITEVNTHGN